MLPLTSVFEAENLQPTDPFYNQPAVGVVAEKDNTPGAKNNKQSKPFRDTFTKEANSGENAEYSRFGKIIGEKNDKTADTNNNSQNAITNDKKTEETEEKDDGNPATEELTPEEEQIVRELERTDRKVRAHEQAHMAAGGNLVKGRAQYQYQTGPNGKKYAVGGEVQIDISPIANDPGATIRKMQQVRRAALAPSDPSAQDRAVAAKASQIEQQARAELNQQRLEEMTQKSKKITNVYENKQQQQDVGNFIDKKIA